MANEKMSAPTDEFIDDIIEVIDKHFQTLTLSTIIGCFEIIKFELLNCDGDEDEDASE